MKYGVCVFDEGELVKDAIQSQIAGLFSACQTESSGRNSALSRVSSHWKE